MSRIDRIVLNATWLPKQDFSRSVIDESNAHISTMPSYTSRQLTLNWKLILLGDTFLQVSMPVTRLGMKLDQRDMATFDMPI